MVQNHGFLQKGNTTKQVGIPTTPTSYKRDFSVNSMVQHIINPVEFDKTNQQMDLKNSESFGKAPRATNALRKGTEKNNVLRNNRIKSEIEATINSPISCLDRADFGYYSMVYLV